MKTLRMLMLTLTLGATWTAHAVTPTFTDPDLDGCLLVTDMDGRELLRIGGEQCSQRLAPCSTFKVPNALIGLETGVLEDGGATYEWDGTEQYFDSWERDHTLVSAIQNSVVWYFQRLAEGVGEERMAQQLEAFDYGNRDISGGLTTFWLNSTLLISAEEQVAFLGRLYRGELAVHPQHATIVRDALVVESGDGWAFSGKTGTARLKDGVSHSWFVGHATHDGRQVLFAGWGREDEQIWGRQIRDAVAVELRRHGWLPGAGATQDP